AAPVSATSSYATQPQPAHMMQQPSYTNLGQILSTLRNSDFPSQREWAVEALGAGEWRNNSEVIAALLTAANQDSAGSVRAACVRTLARMNMKSAQVAGAFQVLQSDIDARVRFEATQALAQMGMATPTPAPATAPAKSGLLKMFDKSSN